MYRDFRRSFPLKSALSLLVLTHIVSTAVQPCSAYKRKHPERVIISEKPTLDLIEKLGHQPELITPEYLQYVLGRPAKRNVADGSNTTYHWLTNAGGIGTQDCELTQTLDPNKRIIKSFFKINIPMSTVTLVDIEKKINDDRANYAAGAAQAGSLGSGSGIGTTSAAATGTTSAAAAGTTSAAATGTSTTTATGSATPALPPEVGRKLFDQQCRPSLKYSFVPYTTVLYTQAPNTFHVHLAQITYVGPPLPPPSQQDIASVATEMRTRALAHNVADKHHLAVPMLNDHLYGNPSDAEAHYALGVSYQKASQLNDAIAEYQLALRYSNGDSVVANNAIQSLQNLHVIQSPDDRIDFHTLKFKQDGQGLTEGDVIATQDRQSLLANQAPYPATMPPINSAYNPGLSGSPGYSLNAASPNGLPPYVPSGSMSSSYSNTSYAPGNYSYWGRSNPTNTSYSSSGAYPSISYPPTSSYRPNSYPANTSYSSSNSYPSSASMMAAAPPSSSGSQLVGLKAPPAKSLNAPTSLAAAGLRPPISSGSGISFNSDKSSSSGAGTPTTGTANGGQPSFYDSMQYGSNLFPASAPTVNLEPGF
jgi:tetratricopeptide (TPR) repeat protein